jgi:hypothetical protein
VKSSNRLSVVLHSGAFCIDTSATCLCTSSRAGTDSFPRGYLPDLPSPSSKCLHDFGEDSGCQRHPDEDEGFVHGVGQGELGVDTYHLSLAYDT